MRPRAVYNPDGASMRRQLPAQLGVSRRPTADSKREMVRRSGQAVPDRTLRMVPSSTPASRATQRTLRLCVVTVGGTDST